MRNDYGQYIKDRVDIRDVAVRYGLELNRLGFARCPFHNEKTASFKIRDKMRAHCFGCGVNVDAISLTMQLLGIPFLEAVHRINDDFFLGLVMDRKPTLREQRDAKRHWKEHNEKLQKARQEKQQYEQKYELLWSIWTLYDKWLTQYAPQNTAGEIHPCYEAAAKNIKYIEHRIDTEL